MKKIINGKMYNTETAKEVGNWWNGVGCGDFEYCSETLFLKKTGEFFLYGSGGALSKYAEYTGNGCSSGGDVIEPFTVSQAQTWIEKNLDAEIYISLFGEVEE